MAKNDPEAEKKLEGLYLEGIEKIKAKISESIEQVVGSCVQILTTQVCG